MEYEFIHARGTIQVNLEAGFELLATWIEQELLPFPKRISTLQAALSALLCSTIPSWQLPTSEHLLHIDEDELQLTSNAVINAQLQQELNEPPADGEFDGYATELEQVGCGTDDFNQMFQALLIFMEEEGLR